MFGKSKSTKEQERQEQERKYNDALKDLVPQGTDIRKSYGPRGIAQKERQGRGFD